MDERKRRRPGAGPPMSPVANQGARLVVMQPELTPWQKVRKWRHDRLPHATDINTLFIATERHHVRLDWRHPLAIPFVTLLVVLSPLLLVVASVFWVLDKLEAWWRARANKGRDGR